MNELGRRFSNDTLACLDSLVALYSADGDLESKYKLAFLSMEQGAWSAGLTILYGIPAQYNLSAEQQNGHERIIEFCELISSFDGYSTDSTGVQELTSIMESENGAASMYALNMLIDLEEVNYEEPIEMPDFMKSAAETGTFYSLNNSSNGMTRMLRVMPNPAEDYIIVEYNLEMQEEGIISIADVTGKPVYSVQVSNPKDQLTLDTRNWKRGIYIAALKTRGILKETFKFTLSD